MEQNPCSISRQVRRRFSLYIAFMGHMLCKWCTLGNTTAATCAGTTYRPPMLSHSWHSAGDTGIPRACFKIVLQCVSHRLDCAVRHCCCTAQTVLLHRSRSTAVQDNSCASALHCTQSTPFSSLHECLQHCPLPQQHSR